MELGDIVLEFDCIRVARSEVHRPANDGLIFHRGQG
jgi:hypothetical protein